MRKEIFNFKDEEAPKKFKMITSSSNYLSSVFDKNISVNDKAKLFLKRLNKVIRKCFKKIQIGVPKENEFIQRLFQKRRSLQNNDSPQNRIKLEKIEKMLGNILAEKNVKIIKENTKKYKL